MKLMKSGITFESGKILSFDKGEMKEFEMWLENKIINYRIRRGLPTQKSATIGKVASLLPSLFEFKDTKEGIQYWNDVVTKLWEKENKIRRGKKYEEEIE